MIAVELIDNNVPYLKSSDKVFFAINLMQERGLRCLPVLEDGVYVGMATEEILLEMDDEATIASLTLEYPDFIVAEGEHLLFLLKEMASYQVELIPVKSVYDNAYLGVISAAQIVNFLQKNMAILQEGGVLVLQMQPKDYSLSEIARIVESNGAHIVFCYLGSAADKGKVQCTLKIDMTDLSGILQSFERYHYEVVSTFHQSINEASLKQRLDSLLHYLNV
ncbi:MAG: CBS domain-containing protein [Chitinophagales bacterium]|nr:CBS domain-containing protein [Chitinophagales bacterium]